PRRMRNGKLEACRATESSRRRGASRTAHSRPLRLSMDMIRDCGEASSARARCGARTLPFHPPLRYPLPPRHAGLLELSLAPSASSRTFSALAAASAAAAVGGLPGADPGGWVLSVTGSPGWLAHAGVAPRRSSDRRIRSGEARCGL